jgi:hypothetical protein
VRSNSFHPRESNLLLWELIKTTHPFTETLDYSFGYLQHKWCCYFDNESLLLRFPL